MADDGDESTIIKMMMGGEDNAPGPTQQDWNCGDEMTKEIKDYNQGERIMEQNVE